MDSAFNVVVVGNVGIDTNIYLHDSDIDFSVESNFTENIDYVGQAGGYTARGFARLGKKTAFIGHVGDDHNGRFIREEFANDKIDTTALFTDPAGTSRSVNFMYRDGRRKNFYDGKSHINLHPDATTCEQVLTEAKAAHFNIPNWARDLLPIAKNAGLIVSCDIQDVTDLRDTYRTDFIDSADILFFSAVNQDTPEDFIRVLLDKNPQQIVISGMGAKGCMLGTREKIQFFPAVHMDLPVIDTNGAGDGLAVGFIAGYVLGDYSIEESVLRGQIAARYTCAQRASSSDLISEELLDGYFTKIEV